MRVVTTLPSATELVAALGIEPVGVSHECDYPPGVADQPSVTRSRIDAAGSSAEIDRQVRDATSEGADPGVYDVDTEAIDRLDPDVIVTQGVCDVCAVDEVIVERAIEEVDTDPRIVTIDAHTIEVVFDDLERLGHTLGREARAKAVRADLEERLDAIRERTPDDPDERPQVAVFDWTDPVMVAAHWVPELVSAAGGTYDLASAGEDARPREWDEIRDADPDVLVVAPCGFDLEQTAATLDDLTEREGWAELTAVRTDRTWVMDGHHYLNRPGPRLVDAAEILARILHPRAFADESADADPRATASRAAADVAVPLSSLQVEDRS